MVGARCVRRFNDLTIASLGVICSGVLDLF